MYQVQVSSLQAAVLLVDEDSGPALIINNDPNFNLWLGDSQATSPAIPQEAIPIAPNGYLAVDGKRAVFGIADPGTTTVQVFVIPGGMAFFQFLTQLVISGSAAGLFIYSPIAGFGNLVGSWSAVAGVDKYGNAFPAGINAFQGQLSGVSVSNSNIIAAVINQSVINGGNISGAAIAGGTMTETVVKFDSTGGQLVMYASSTTTVTQTVNGLYTFTVPANVLVADVSTWGAASGAGGGLASEGGEGGGGGGFSRNPSYPLTPGSIVSYIVGNGGTGGTTGNSGNGGEDTIFDTANSGVVAFGAAAGAGGFQGGIGGPANPAMPISFAGGNGANGSGTASAGGGSSAGSASNGNNGTSSAGATPGIGGAAPIGGAAGGNGVAANANGNAGANPGGGGSGAGAASTGTQVNKSYGFSSSGTYYGSDASGTPNGKKNSTPSDGTMYQGGETASGGSFNGTQKALAIISGNPVADLAGVTIDSVTMRFSNFHTWYNSGATLTIGHNNRTSLPSSWNAADITVDKNAHINEGATTSFDLSLSGLGTALKSGAAKAITLGPGSGGFNLNNYAGQYGTGGAAGQNPLLTVKGHTGTGTVIAGPGSDGKVSFTYTTGTTLVAGASPIATVDAFGNALAAGFTGPITAIQPGSNPAVVETWHNLILDAGWSTDSIAAIPQYRMLPDGSLQVAGRAFQAFFTGTKTMNALNPLPAAYRPVHAHDFRYGDLLGQRCHMSIASTGIISAIQPNGSTAGNLFAELDANIPLT